MLALLSTGDTETFKAGLPAWVDAYQVVVIAGAAAGLVLAGIHLGSRRRRAAEPA